MLFKSIFLKKIKNIGKRKRENKFFYLFYIEKSQILSQSKDKIKYKCHRCGESDRNRAKYKNNLVRDSSAKVVFNGKSIKW